MQEIEKRIKLELENKAIIENLKFGTVNIEAELKINDGKPCYWTYKINSTTSLMLNKKS